MSEELRLKKIKALLVMLAEFLQTTLSDAQVLLYADDLKDLSPEHLEMAIAAVKADESVWPGRFVLPAKLRAYLNGSLNERANESARNVLSMTSQREAMQGLSRQEYKVFCDYGANAILDRKSDHTSALFSQLRDSFRVVYAREQSLEAIAETRDKQDLLAEKTKPKEIL